MYAFALRNTTVNHIRGCVVKILYPTLPRFQSKMAIVWDRSIHTAPAESTVDSTYCLPQALCEYGRADRESGRNR